MKKFFAAAFVAVTAVNLTGCSLLKRESPRGEPNSSPMSSSYSTTTSTDTQPSKSSTDNLSKPESSPPRRKAPKKVHRKVRPRRAALPKRYPHPKRAVSLRKVRREIFLAIL